MRKVFIFALLALASSGAALAQNIVALEYSVDIDPGFGNATSVTLSPEADGTFDFEVSTTGLSKGWHTLYFRTLDENGFWSHTSYRTIEILDDVALNQVEGTELFDDGLGDFGTGTFMAFDNPQPDGSFVLNFPYSQLQEGEVTLFLRTKDSKELWSFPASVTFTLILEDDPPVGLEEINNNAFSVYPNPASSELTIACNELPEKKLYMTLTDMTGKVVKSLAIQKAKTILLLNHAPGIYLLNIQNEEGGTVMTKKITIR